MKRGNTALKRAVSVTSVAAMAIAGAVLAAPSASAWTVPGAGTLTYSANSVRAIPTADAAWMNASGSVNTSPAVGAVTYSAGMTGTSSNLTVGKSGQAATGIQILIPTTSGGVPSWPTGSTAPDVAARTLTVTLAGGGATASGQNVTFAGTPTATLSATPVDDPTDLKSLAGVNNAAAHQSPVALQTAGTAADATHAVALENTSATAKKDTSNGAVLNVTLPDPGTAAGYTGGASAYLLTITGITVNVAALNANTAVNAPVSATVSLTDTAGTSTPLGVTTVGYINAVNIATNGDSTVTGSTVSLPGIVLAEAQANEFGTTPVQVKVTGTANPGTTLALSAAGSKVSGTAPLNQNAITATVDGTNNQLFDINFTSSAATAPQSVVATGLTVGNVKPGTDVTLSVVKPKSGVTNDSGAGQFSFVAPQAAGSSVTVSPTTALPRLFGTDRYDTAAKIADKLGATNAVILANGDNAKLGVDALSANFLAGVKDDAPVLLTSADSLPKATSDELTSLFENSTASITLYVMGKTDSVSQKVRDAAVAAIKAKAVNALASVTVVEVSGSDRYATSAATVDKAGASNIGSYNLGAGSRNTAFLASGQVNADALAASAVSAGLDIPVLLTTDGKTLPDSVQKVITDDNITQVVILGSTDRVSQDVQDALTKAGVNVKRIAGTDRYDTAQQIATLALKTQPNGLGQTNGGTVYLANGQGGWADALAVGPLAGADNASLVTVSDGASLPGSTAVFLASNKGNFDSVEGLGNTDRVTDSALKQAIAISGLS